MPTPRCPRPMRGFQLPELMLVILLIALLVALTLPLRN